MALDLAKVEKVTSFHPGIVSGPLAEELYLNVIVAALQDPDTGVPVTKRMMKEEVIRVFTGSSMFACLQQYRVDKLRAQDIGCRLLEAGFVRTADKQHSEFRETATYYFSDVIVLDRRYIESKLTTALSYFTAPKTTAKREPPTLIGKLRRLVEVDAEKSAASTPSSPIGTPPSPSPRDKDKDKEKSSARPPRQPVNNNPPNNLPPLEKSVIALEKSLSVVTSSWVSSPSTQLPQSSQSATVDEGESLIEEDSDEIVFMIVPDDPVPVVKAATLDKLIERLTLDKFVDLRFQSKFLLTYRSFTDPITLLNKLQERYRAPTASTPANVTIEGHELQRILKIVKMRVVMVIARWIQDFWDDWRNRDDLRVLLFTFLDTDVMPGPLAQLGAQLKSNYQKMASQTPALFKSPTARFGYTPMSMIAAPQDPFAPVFVFDEGRVLDAAQQMCLRDFDRLTAIHYDEFLGKKWSKRAREELAPGIVTMTNEFNLLSEATVQEIVSTLQLRARVAVVQKYINLCLKLKELHNFHSCMAVRAALLSAPVKRLAATWAEVPQALRNQFEELERQFSYSSSYKAYRALLRGTQQPLIPYLGLYLTDLTFIEDGNPDTLGPLINFQKCSLIAKVIEDIRMYQSIGFDSLWKVNPSIQAWLANFKPTIASEQAYQLSLRIEPRNAQETLERMLMEEEALRERLREYEMRIATLEQENSRLKEQLTVLDNDLRVQIRNSATPPNPRYSKGGSALYTTIRKKRDRTLVDAALANPAAPVVPFEATTVPEPSPRLRSSREALEPMTSGQEGISRAAFAQQQIDSALAEALKLAGSVSGSPSSPATSFSPLSTSLPQVSPPRSVSPVSGSRSKPPNRPIPPLPSASSQRASPASSPKADLITSPSRHRPTLGPLPTMPPPLPPSDIPQAHPPTPLQLSPKPSAKQHFVKPIPLSAISATPRKSPARSPNGKQL